MTFEFTKVIMGRNCLSKFWLERQFNIIQACLLAFYCQIHTLHDRSRSHWVQYRIHQGFEIGHQPRNYLHFLCGKLQIQTLTYPGSIWRTYHSLQTSISTQRTAELSPKKKRKKKSTTIHVCSNKEHNCTVNNKYYEDYFLNPKKFNN
jgi:hypothetical protein